jgi:excinuclease UvrABC nuclease subunit
MTPQVKARFSSDSEEPLPDSPGIYFLCRNAEIVYVGKTTRIAERVASHRNTKAFDSVLVLRVPEKLLNFCRDLLD